MVEKPGSQSTGKRESMTSMVVFWYSVERLRRQLAGVRAALDEEKQ